MYTSPRPLIVAAAFAGLLPAAGAQQGFDDVRIETTHVAGAVHMLTGRGGNIAVSAGEDGLLMVDDQFAPLAPRIRAALEKLAQGRGRLRFVINTHWHRDHTGGNPEFGREATILAHDNVRKRLTQVQEIFGRRIEPLPRDGWPVITFDRSVTIHFNGEPIRVIHLPHGHTDGDSIVWFTKSGVVHLGDDFFAGRFPFVDLDSGGSVQGLIRNVRHVLETIPADAKIIPGHGPLSTRDDLKAFLEMLTETTEIVRKRIADGQSLEQAQAAGLPEKWTDWGSGFISTQRWIEIVYRSLSDERHDPGDKRHHDND